MLFKRFVTSDVIWSNFANSSVHDVNTAASQPDMEVAQGNSLRNCIFFSFANVVCEFSDCVFSRIYFHIHCNLSSDHLWLFKSCVALLIFPQSWPFTDQMGLNKSSFYILLTKSVFALPNFWNRMEYIEFLDSFDKIDLYPALFLEWDWIDRVFRFFWQNSPLPCLIFEMGWNRSSF